MRRRLLKHLPLHRLINRLLGVHYPAALSTLYQLDLKPTHWWVIDAEEQWQQVPRTEVGELYL